MRGAAFAATSLLVSGIAAAVVAALDLGFGVAGLAVLATFSIGAVLFVATEATGAPGARPVRTGLAATD